MIEIHSPTRVDLAGGTLDCWPLHLFVGDCVTVNLAIDIMTGCQISIREDKKIHVEIKDLKFNNEFENLEELINGDHKETLIIKYIVEYFKPDFGFNICTFSRSPIGGGIGGSSSLTISILKAFHKLMNIETTEMELVELAHNLEAKAIRNPTGTQDYVPAISGGLSIIHYTCARPRVEKLDVHLKGLAENIMLIYTGKAHHSGINNWQVIKSVIEGNDETLSALKEIAKISFDTAEACRNEKWSDLPQLFQAEFDARIRLTPSFTSPEIEKLKKIAIAEGGESVKICGAGGGGCVLVWAKPKFQERISEECQKSGFQHLKIQPALRS